jgi:uncharacterized protein DUF2382
MVVPIYEEQLVVSKRVVLRDRLGVRRVRTTQRQLFEDTVRRERLVVEDAHQSGMVHEIYPAGEGDSAEGAPGPKHDETIESADGNFLTKLVTKALE